MTAASVDQAAPGASLGSDAAGLVALKLVVSIFVLATGFQGISDDDFARVVIAQGFAHAPHLDPSGTSWLPLPFQITGAAMMAFGGDLAVARVVAVLLGVGAVVLVHRAAWILTEDRQSALAGAAIAAVLPWSARLGVSAVPELPVAALTLFALAAIARPTATRLVAGGACLLAACLSRYEPWLVTAPWAFFVLTSSTSVTATRKVDVSRAAKGIAVALAFAGPLAWSLWNLRVHGSLFHYVDRVSAYNAAVDHDGVATRAVGYVFATFRAEPELVLLLAFVAYQLFDDRGRRAWLPFLSFRRPAFILGFLFVALTVLSIRGGAPTHHPERALLALHLFGAVVLGRAVVFAAKGGALPLRRALVFALILAPAMLVLRSWYLFKESFADRADEVAIGQDVATMVPADQRVAVEVVDYGYFAVLAGTRAPWRADLAGEVRPGTGGDPQSPEQLFAATRAKGDRFAVGRTPEGEPPGARILSLRGKWALYEVDPDFADARK